MLKTLAPVDGSDCSLRAVKWLIRQAKNCKEPLEIHLLNVQHPFPGTIRGVAGQAKKHHHDQGIKSLAKARSLLDAAKLDYSYHIGVGDVGDVVAQFVRELKCDQVLMGTRGLGSVANMVLGSAASKVLHLVKVPVLLVK